jgi:protein-tyrosine phosphatase
MIDLHCHILPGIDDGPADMDGALELARALVADGVATVAATPHYRYDHPRVTPDAILARCDELAAALAAEGIPLQVVPAAEVDINSAFGASDEELQDLSYGQTGRCVLVETPYSPIPSNFEDLLFRAVSLRGMNVLLAHPERNPTLLAEPARLEALVRRGVLLQVTAGALINPKRRSRSKRLALHLVEEGLAHVIATDAHSADGRRRPNMTAAVAAAARVAPTRADWLVTEAPAAILAGEPIPPPPSRLRRFRPGHVRQA